jgi:hypothetical protein
MIEGKGLSIRKRLKGSRCYRQLSAPSWDALQVLKHYPAKIPHFFENLQIFAFYAILFITSFIVRQSFIIGL